METIIVFVKNYFLFLLVLYLISYLFCERAHDRGTDETGAWFSAEGCEG